MSIPQFPEVEGAEVSAAILKVSGAIELTDVVAHVDDVIEITVQLKVTSVNHQVHTTSGRLMRIQTAKAIEAWGVGE